MKYIAHRGLYQGPDRSKENHPEQILEALDLDYDCEIDLWVENSELYLGHDEPQYLVDQVFLSNAGLWIHAKNLAALRWLCNESMTYFWHETDAFTLTSNGYIWTYPGQPLTGRSIMCMPETADPSLESAYSAQCYGICSDWIERIKTVRN